jgi:hypothetical protein
MTSTLNPVYVVLGGLAGSLFVGDGRMMRSARSVSNWHPSRSACRSHPVWALSFCFSRVVRLTSV